MFKRIKRYIPFIVIAILFVLVYFRCNRWYQKLSGRDGRLTVAHVYESYEMKAHRYFNYIYKVGGSFYTTSTSGHNVTYDGDQVPVQSFLVAYYLPDPTFIQ